MNTTSKESKSQSGKRPIYSGSGRVIGDLIGDTFTKGVHGSKHMLRNPRAWAVDAVAIEQAHRAGAKVIEVRDLDTRVIYHASMELFLRQGIKLNRGFGSQIALPLDRWTVIEDGRTGAVQMKLFGGAA